MEQPYGLGCNISTKDIRTFAYAPDPARRKGGARYLPGDIEHQHKVGICTGISKTQKSRKVLKKKWSADFQYGGQKKFIDGNWEEGSSIFSALKFAKGKRDKHGNFLYGGLLPEEYWTFTTEEDRKLPYHKYIKKLQAIPDSEWRRLFKISEQYAIKAYAKLPSLDRDTLANAIDESEGGIIARFVIGKEWWTPPIEPLRPAAEPISGHAVIISNFDGGSFRIANTWGPDWADKGTAYFLLRNYQPTEAWIVYYDDTPAHVDEELKKREELLGQLADLLQKILDALQKK